MLRSHIGEESIRRNFQHFLSITLANQALSGAAATVAAWESGEPCYEMP